jgi:hypothetical protein
MRLRLGTAYSTFLNELLSSTKPRASSTDYVLGVAQQHLMHNGKYCKLFPIASTLIQQHIGSARERSLTGSGGKG